MGSRRILVVDDERNMQAVLKLLFEGEGWDATCVSDGSEALALLEAGEEFGVIVSDLKMDRVDGIGLLRAIRERGSAVPFVLITAFGTVEKAVEAMKLGAIDVVTKPFAKEIILAIVSRVFRMASLEDENEMLRAGRSTKDDLVYRSPAMRDIVSLLDRIGPASSPVLITGESGTGKEVAARSLHRLHAGGDFDARPFVSVNCPAVPETLLESELFGYRKGAFTGADRDYKGRVELARGGTLFFDEIGDLPLSIQPKILRLLENRSYEPLGSGHTREVDIRIVCATNRNLKRLVAEGRFREDLLYRINTFTIELPPLRERREDIEALALFFLARYARETGKDFRGIAPKALSALVAHDWPGNSRELKNAIERAVVLGSGPTLALADLPKELADSPKELAGTRGTVPSEAPGTWLHPKTIGEGALATAATATATATSATATSATFAITAITAAPATATAAATTADPPSRIDEAELSLILQALRGAEGNISAAARDLGITRNTLRYRMKKHGLDL